MDDHRLPPAGATRDGLSEATRDLIRRLAYGLEASLDHLDAQARAEARAEEGKGLRNVTKQRRARMARAAVAEAFDLLGLEP